MLAVGAGLMSITPSGFEQYDLAARSIADQVVDPNNRQILMPCRPKSPRGVDDICARRIFQKYGRLIYRRSLTEPELGAKVNLAHQATTVLNDFYAGISSGLASMLNSPSFLFFGEPAVPRGDNPAGRKYVDIARPTRLSYLLWNSTPDEALISAMERGELDTRQGLAKEIDRMIASPKFAKGVRAFFSDMLAFDEFSDLTKDPAIYPNAGAQIIKDAREQTLRTIVHHVVDLDADYRDLYTTRKTFLSRALAYMYHVPFVPGVDWRAFEFPAGSPRTGMLTQLSFLMLHAHPGRSSPTKRGKAVRELLLCQRVPDPPANVNFSIVQDASNPDFKTARSRLTAHNTDAACAACHKTFDPIGLGLEKFDGSGEYRTTENGAVIDASGALDGTAYGDSDGLASALRNNPQLVSCLVTRAYEYTFARAPKKGERPILSSLQSQFASEGYRVRELFRRLAMQDLSLNPELSKPTGPLSMQGASTSSKESIP